MRDSESGIMSGEQETGRKVRGVGFDGKVRRIIRTKQTGKLLAALSFHLLRWRIVPTVIVARLPFGLTSVELPPSHPGSAARPPKCNV